jgi:hypothetical protein
MKISKKTITTSTSNNSLEEHLRILREEHQYYEMLNLMHQYYSPNYDEYYHINI